MVAGWLHIGRGIRLLQPNCVREPECFDDLCEGIWRKGVFLSARPGEVLLPSLAREGTYIENEVKRHWMDSTSDKNWEDIRSWTERCKQVPHLVVPRVDPRADVLDLNSKSHQTSRRIGAIPGTVASSV